MPEKPKRPCRHTSCPELTRHKTGYCEQHRKTYARYAEQNYERPERHKFYNTQPWRRTRKRQLARQPICEHCLERGVYKLADMVDHIIPIKDNWELRLSTKNLQSLCNQCHAIKTRSDREREKCKSDR